jgi:hypothetical protein
MVKSPLPSIWKALAFHTDATSRCTPSSSYPATTQPNVARTLRLPSSLQRPLTTLHPRPPPKIAVSSSPSYAVETSDTLRHELEPVVERVWELYAEEWSGTRWVRAGWASCRADSNNIFC